MHQQPKGSLLCWRRPGGELLKNIYNIAFRIYWSNKNRIQYKQYKLGLARERTDKCATISVDQKVTALTLGCGAVDRANTHHGGQSW